MTTFFGASVNGSPNGSAAWTGADGGAGVWDAAGLSAGDLVSAGGGTGVTDGAGGGAGLAAGAGEGEAVGDWAGAGSANAIAAKGSSATRAARSVLIRFIRYSPSPSSSRPLDLSRRTRCDLPNTQVPLSSHDRCVMGPFMLANPPSLAI